MDRPSQKSVDPDQTPRNVTPDLGLHCLPLIKHYYTYLQIKGDIHIIFFLFLDKNICCGYSLEAPRGGASNEYPQHMCFWEIRKISAFFSDEKSA